MLKVMRMALTSVLPQFAPMTVIVTPRTSPLRRRAVAIDAREAIGLWRRKAAVFIDLRDWEVLDQMGWIEGAMHCPPGEFFNIVSPSSALHTRLFEPGKIFIFYGSPECSPLACAKRARELGLDGAHALRGGLKAWRNAGGRTAGHPSSAFPALKASLSVAARYAKGRLAVWWRGVQHGGSRLLKKSSSPSRFGR